MHRLLILSSAYQQSSIAGTIASESQHDAHGGDLFSPFSRRRLCAEELRDSILATSGDLDRRVARGHPFPRPVSWQYTQHNPFNRSYNHDKRSVFLMTQRIKRHPFLALFDGADPNATTPTRATTTVPTQALFFLNDSFVHTKAENLARLLLAAPTDDAQRVELAWQKVLQRSPSELEREEAAGFLEVYRSELAAAGRARDELRPLAAYIRTLFASNEFIYLD
jgi:hypothetical protein